jgi:hypothetical protein
VGGEVLAQAAGGDAFEAADEPGQSDLGRVVHQEVHVVSLSVELPQLCAEVLAHLPRDLFASGEDGVGEDLPSVLRREDQVCVEGVDDASSPAYIGVWFPAR